MRVNMGVSSWLTKRGSKGSCCFFKRSERAFKSKPISRSCHAIHGCACTSKCVFPFHQVYRLTRSFRKIALIDMTCVSFWEIFRYHWLLKHATLYHTFNLVLAYKNNTHLSNRLISECTKGERIDRQTGFTSQGFKFSLSIVGGKT